MSLPFVITRTFAFHLNYIAVSHLQLFPLLVLLGFVYFLDFFCHLSGSEGNAMDLPYLIRSGQLIFVNLRLLICKTQGDNVPTGQVF